MVSFRRWGNLYRSIWPIGRRIFPDKLTFGVAALLLFLNYVYLSNHRQYSTISTKADVQTTKAYQDDNNGEIEYQDPGISIPPLSSQQPPRVLEAPIPEEENNRSALKRPKWLQEQPASPIKRSLESQLLDPFHDKWHTVKLGNNQTIHMYSAFFDNRREHEPPFIRINVAARIKYRALHGNTRCLIETVNGSIITTTVAVLIQREHFSLPWSSFFVMCQLHNMRGLIAAGQKGPVRKSQVKAVTLADRDAGAPWTHAKTLPQPRLQVHKFPVKKEGDKEFNLAVCVKPFHYNFDRAVWLVEFIEMYRLLGASHFIFYNHTVGPNVEAILQYYVKHGLASLLNWNLPLESQKEIRTEAMFSAMNDCSLRSVNKFEFVAMVDIDEYLIPTAADNLTSLLASKTIAQPKGGAFVFRNVFHYLYWENDTALIEEALPDDQKKERHPYLLTQSKLRRVKEANKNGQRSKYVLRPTHVTMVGNHVVWKFINNFKQVFVPPHEGLSHHYRICEFGGYDCLKKASIVDKRPQFWGPQLVNNVAIACQHIFNGDTCPEAPPLGHPW